MGALLPALLPFLIPIIIDGVKRLFGWVQVPIKPEFIPIVTIALGAAYGAITGQDPGSTGVVIDTLNGGAVTAAGVGVHQAYVQTKKI